MTDIPAIDATGLVKTFGPLRAVDGIDLEVRQGEIFGVLGPNGAGKTTALRMLATLLPIDAGQARVFGVDVAREPHRIRQLIGITGQYASVDEDLTATENLWMFGRIQGLRSADARSGCWPSSTWRRPRTSRSRSSPGACAAALTSRSA
jgi:ABC-2 type transport system ATP-binding protein